METARELNELESEAMKLKSIAESNIINDTALLNYANRVLERVARCKRQLNLSSNTPKRKRKNVSQEVSDMERQIMADILYGTSKPLKNTRKISNH